MSESRSRFLSLTVLGLFIASASAETRVWVGSGNWSAPANWSGGAAPGAGDDVVFDASSTNSAVVDGAAGGAVASVAVLPGYTGFITQNRDLSVGWNMVLSGGVWRYTAGTAAVLTVGGNLTVAAVLQAQRSSTSGNGAGRTFLVGGDVTIGSSGVVDATAMGFNLNDGPGKPPGTQGAGGHGGVGGNWNNSSSGGGGGPAYGSVTNPSSLGSGGKGSGSFGGGAIRLLADGSVVVDGLVAADGAVVIATISGTGAGGSIFIRAGGALSGSGLVRAQGGYFTNVTFNSQSPYSTGAGGRIALEADSISLPLANISASSRWSGSYGMAGAAGTVFLRSAADPDGTLLVDARDVSTAAGAWPKPTTLLGPLVSDLPSGSVWIRNRGDLQVASNSTLTVNGYWTNSASFTGSDGSTVSFATDRPAALSGSSSFFHLTCIASGKTVSVATGSTLTVRGVLTLKGASGNPLILRAAGAGSWYLTVSNAALLHEVRHVDVASSHAGNGTTIAAYQSVDSGGNVNWAFAEEGQTNTWTGAVSTNWGAPGNWSLARVPVSSDVVIIPAAARNPALDFDKMLFELRIGSGGVLNLARRNVLLTGNLTVNGTFAASGSERVDLLGSADLTGGLIQSASSTVRLLGTGPQTIVSGAAAAFNRLELLNTNATLTFTDRVRATNLYVYGSTASFADGAACAGVLENQGGALTFGGPVTATLILTTNAPVVFGDTVTASVVSNLNGSLAFGGNVTCSAFFSDGADTLTFAPGATAAIASLWLNGSDTAPLLLRSGTPGSRWNLNVSRDAGVVRADVRDSDASGGLTIRPVLSADSGNNLNWDFSTTASWTRWAGGLSADFMNPTNWSPSAAPGPASWLLIDGFYTNAPRLLPASTVTVARLLIGGPRAAVLTGDGLLTVGDELAVIPRGIVTHTANTTSELYRLDLVVGGDLTVAGAIDAGGRGYAAGRGPGAGTANQGGGGHGGVGGDWNTQTGPGGCYGSITQPVRLGSGGVGGPGGGAIRLRVAGHSRVDGVVAADGADLPVASSAAGSGGSVWLTTGTLDGTGVIRADGGLGGNYNGVGYAHGGGGRVAVYLEESDDFGGVQIRAVSKRGYATVNHRGGGPGSVYLKKASQPRGTCIVDSLGLANVRHATVGPAVTNAETGDFILRGATTAFQVESGQTFTVYGNWSNGAIFMASGAVHLAGAEMATLYGNTPFGDLLSTTAGKTLRVETGRTVTVNGLLRLQGVALRSAVDGSPWRLTLHSVTGTQDIRRVTVRDSNATGGKTLYALPHSTDLGNNFNWEFAAEPGTLIIVR